MSVIAGLIGSLAGGGAPKSAALTSTTFEPLNEGQQQTIGVNFYNWDTSVAYWTVTDSSGYPIGGQVDRDSGTINPGPGDTYYSFNFTFASDATTEGPVSYYIRLGSTVHGNEYFNEGPKTVRDSSQAPALVLSVDPASITTPMNQLSGWYNTVGSPLNIINGSKSANNGGTLVFNGTSTYVDDAGYNNLTNATYGTITLSAWIKPTAVTGSNQVIIAKELCYKLRINGDGTVTLGTAKGYAPWEVTATVTTGTVTAGAWHHILATVDASHTRIYVNGIKVTDTTGNIIGANTSTFGIGTDNGAQGDLFTGSMGEVKIWNYAITEADVITEYNTTADRYGRSLLPLSLNFPGTGNPYLLVSNTQTDWNLGSTYTIEFWSKGGNASNGAIRTVMSQTDGSGNIDLGYAYTHLMFNGTEPNYAEPTAGVWTHVAFVAEGDGVVKLYYNGVYQTYFSAGPALTNGASDLYIGKRATYNGQGFYGKLALIRISNAAKYTASFTPSTTYGIESDTKLLLGFDPLTDKTTTHPVSVQGAVGVSSDFPNKAVVTNVLFFSGQGNGGDCVWAGADLSNPTVVALLANGDLTGWTVTYTDGQGYSATVTAMNPLGYPSVTLSVRPSYITGRTLIFTSPHY